MNERPTYLLILQRLNASFKWMMWVLLIVFIQHHSWMFAYTPDTTNVAWRKFDEAQLEKFRKDKDFDYRDKEPTKAKETISWLEKWLRDLFDIELGRETNEVIYDIITIVLIVGALAALIWAFTSVQFRWIFSGKGAKASPVFTIEEENIHEISFTNEIAAAEAAGNFRKAVRLHYLEMLKALSDHSLIAWETQKTNHDYARELRNTEYADDFSGLTYWFDYIWYGELPVDDGLYADIREKFRKFPVKPDHSVISINSEDAQK
jgi:hypothetical protein